jgi:hypothetical protein
MASDTSTPCMLGVHIAAGTAYLAVVACPDTPLYDDPLERIQLAAGASLPEQVADFSGRFKQELRRIRPAAVGVVFPKLYSQWKYSAAFTRVSVETAIILAVEELSTPAHAIKFVQVKQDAMAKKVGIPLPKMASEGKKRWAGISRYQAERVYAFAAATALAEAQCP